MNKKCLLSRGSSGLIFRSCPGSFRLEGKNSHFLSEISSTSLHNLKPSAYTPSALRIIFLKMRVPNGIFRILQISEPSAQTSKVIPIRLFTHQPKIPAGTTHIHNVRSTLCETADDTDTRHPFQKKCAMVNQFRGLRKFTEA